MTGFDWAALWPQILTVLLDKPLGVLVIIVVAVLARLVMIVVIRRVVDRVVSGVKRRQGVEDTQMLQSSPLAAVRIVQRTRTIGSVLSNVVTIFVVIVAAILIINTINPDATAAFSLITAALGAGLGFGAQNIIKDVLNGLFMVIEDQLGVGDVVDLGPATGVVEGVGIRITQIRDVNGVLWYVRNGEILRVGNQSQGWSRVVMDLAVPYEADVEHVQERLLATAVEMQQDAKWKRLILEKPEIWGIESISAEAVVVRLVVKTRSGSKDDVARELRARLKRTLDQLDVRMPALNQIVLGGMDGSRSGAPAAAAPAAAAAGKTPAATTPMGQPKTPGPMDPPKRAPRRPGQV